MCIDPHQTRFVGEGSDHLQLIKFWPSHAPGRGSAVGQIFFGSALLQPSRSVCISLSALFVLVLCCQVWDLRHRHPVMKIRECDDYISDIVVDQTKKILLASR